MTYKLVSILLKINANQTENKILFACVNIVSILISWMQWTKQNLKSYIRIFNTQDEEEDDTVKINVSMC